MIFKTFRALVILSQGGINDREPGSNLNSCKRWNFCFHFHFDCTPRHFCMPTSSLHVKSATLDEFSNSF